MQNESWLIKCANKGCRNWYRTHLPTKHISEEQIHYGFNEDGTARQEGVTAMFDRHNAAAIIDPKSAERIIVLGDIHGDLSAFRHGMSLRKAGDLIIFLGDYADRGPHGVEVIEAVDALLKRLPGQIIALKGNHEDYTQAGAPTFSPCTLVDEAGDKRGSWETFFPFFSAFVLQLFLSAILPGRALFIHGGIHGNVRGAADLADPDSHTVNSLLWSDPGSRKGSQPGPRGVGELFGSDVSASVLDSLGVAHLIRGQQPRKAISGQVFEHDGRMITTSCTSIYGGRAFALILDVKEWPNSPDDFADAVHFLS